MFTVGDRMHFPGTSFSFVLTAPPDTQMGFKPGLEHPKVTEQSLALAIGRILDAAPRQVEQFRALSVAKTFFIRPISEQSNRLVVKPAFVVSGFRTAHTTGSAALAELRQFVYTLKSKLKIVFELEKEIEILCIESCGEAVDLRFVISPVA